MSVLDRIATFVRDTQVPPEARIAARSAFLDTVGVMLAGASEPVARHVQRVAAAERCDPSCSILGVPQRTSATWAAMANGAAAHALDFDDMCFVSLAHPSAPLVAAALPLGEGGGASGATLLDGYVVGFEIQAMLGRLMNPAHYRRGWHCTSTLGTISATATAARIAGLSHRQTAHALAIAASEASGLKENFGSMTKPLHAGLAARNGVLAALLAASGLTASDGALDGPQGLVAAMDGTDRDLGSAVRTLGTRWEIVESGITVKLYPSCAATHPMLDAILDVRREHGFTAEHVASIDVQVDCTTPTVLIYEVPANGLEGKFSLHYCAAAAVVFGRVGIDTFDAEHVADPAVLAVARRVTMTVNDSLGQTAPALTQAIVTVRLIDGRVVRREANGARGYPERPATAAELDQKFLGCASKTVARQSAESALQFLRRFDEQPNVRELTEALSPVDSQES